MASGKPYVFLPEPFGRRTGTVFLGSSPKREMLQDFLEFGFGLRTLLN